LGEIVGMVMAYENRERNLWAVEQLNIQPMDRVLEIGFGPGVALQRAAALASTGFIAGVDVSDVMLRQASKRNAAAVHAGRMVLRHGTADALPFEAGSFDKVYAVNSLHHWRAKDKALREIWRVLKPEGVVAIVEQPRRAVPDTEVERLSEDFKTQLAAAGFGQFRVTQKRMKPAPTVCVLGKKS
jgi:ubiquinone/menaquinone biosynthesis C-methylase UbiE